jgi:hypothetical protein
MSSVVIAGDTSGTVTLQAPAVAGSTTVNLPSASGSLLNITTGGVFNIPGLGARITGNFSDNTITNRVAFQSSTTNGNTILELIPNGIGTQCNINLETDSAINNGNVGSIYQNNGQMTIQTVPRGTATATPMTFATNNVEQMRIATNGDLSFNSGYGSAATAYGCRAWVNFAGATGTRNGSGNVTSVTRAGTGQYTINFTTAMPDTAYSVIGSASENGATTNIFLPLSTVTGKTTTSVGAQTLTTGQAYVDPREVNVAIFR